MKTIQLDDKQLFELEVLLGEQLESAYEDIKVYGPNVHQDPSHLTSKHILMLESLIKSVNEAK